MASSPAAPPATRAHEQLPAQVGVDARDRASAASRRAGPDAGELLAACGRSRTPPSPAAAAGRCRRRRLGEGEQAACRPRRRPPAGARGARRTAPSWRAARSTVSTTDESVSDAMLLAAPARRSRAGQLGVAGHVPGRAPAPGRGAGSRRRRRGARRPWPASASSRRIFAYARSSSLTSSRSGSGLPTGVRAPRCDGAVDVELDCRLRSQPAGAAEVVAADGEPVRALDAGAPRAPPARRRAAVIAPSASSRPRGRSVVTPAVSQPLRRPRAEVAPAGRLELGQQVGQRGVAPRVRGEVAPQALVELVAADVARRAASARRRPWRR